MIRDGILWNFAHSLCTRTGIVNCREPFLLPVHSNMKCPLFQMAKRAPKLGQFPILPLFYLKVELFPAVRVGEGEAVAVQSNISFSPGSVLSVA